MLQNIGEYNMSKEIQEQENIKEEISDQEKIANLIVENQLLTHKVIVLAQLAVGASKVLVVVIFVESI